MAGSADEAPSEAVSNNRTVVLKRYKLGRILGRGTFAKVYYARNLKTGMSVAIKMMDKVKIVRARSMDQIQREISIMRLVRHPNVVELYEVMATKHKIFFVMEYVKGGELFSKLKKGRLEEDVARKYFQQLIGALDYCHSRGVYHRDLKPENLLLDENGNLKISDFGLSALAESRRQDGLLHTRCGTPLYVAPEVIRNRGYDGAKADIWSCGVILYVLLAGYVPFYDSNLMEMYRKIKEAEFKFPSWFDKDVRRLLTRILDPNPETRITIDKIKQSPWFLKGLDANSCEGEEDKHQNVDAVFDDVSKNSETVPEGKQGLPKPSYLNAFDIISLSTGLDLSGLFEEKEELKKEVKFISNRGVDSIISKFEDAAKRVGMKVRKKAGGLLKVEGRKEGRKGVLGIDAEIFEIAPDFHLVEVRKSSGDTMEYRQAVKEGIRPSLQDVVWTLE